MLALILLLFRLKWKINITMVIQVQTVLVPLELKHMPEVLILLLGKARNLMYLILLKILINL